MELEQLVELAKNLHEYFHLKRKTLLTNDEYRICNSLLSYRIDIRSLYVGLHLIKQDVESFGNLIVSKRK